MTQSHNNLHLEAFSQIFLEQRKKNIMKYLIRQENPPSQFPWQRCQLFLARMRSHRIRENEIASKPLLICATGASWTRLAKASITAFQRCWQKQVLHKLLSKRSSFDPHLKHSFGSGKWSPESKNPSLNYLDTKDRGKHKGINNIKSFLLCIFKVKNIIKVGAVACQGWRLHPQKKTGWHVYPGACKGQIQGQGAQGSSTS